MEDGSKVCTMGELTLWGSLRVAAETREATWLASLAWSVDCSNARITMLAPVELKELMSVIPLRVETAFSMTCVTC